MNNHVGVKHERGADYQHRLRWLRLDPGEFMWTGSDVEDRSSRSRSKKMKLVMKEGWKAGGRKKDDNHTNACRMKVCPGSKCRISDLEKQRIFNQNAESF